MARQYYSVRSGRSKSPRFDLDSLREMVTSTYVEYDNKYYFQEYFGYDCVDAGFVSGRLGAELSIKKKVLISLRKDLWPFRKSLQNSNEDDLFDIIEFLFDHVSAPKKDSGFIHDWSNCGWHYSNIDEDFDKLTGQEEFRADINNLLECYNHGYKLTEYGEVVTISDKGLEDLLDKEVPFSDDGLGQRLDHAIRLFRNRYSDDNQRLDALLNLAAILESLRVKAEKVLTKKDEGNLFTILNEFGIRHSNLKQQKDYDKLIFYCWMFYYYLSAIHACQHLINRSTEDSY